jgi:hypothetical protein
MHHVGEQDGDLLVLRAGVAVVDWSATAMTKASVL